MKTIKIINNELIEIVSYRNPELVFHNSNNPRHVEPEYVDFESYCDFKEIINPFVLYEENQQLQSKWNSLREYYKRKVEETKNSTALYDKWTKYSSVLSKMNELERVDND